MVLTIASANMEAPCWLPCAATVHDRGSLAEQVAIAVVIPQEFKKGSSIRMTLKAPDGAAWSKLVDRVGEASGWLLLKTVNARSAAGSMTLAAIIGFRQRR